MLNKIAFVGKRILILKLVII